MKNKNSKDLTDWDIVKDENWEYWLYLYWNYSSFEPDKRKWKKLIYKGYNILPYSPGLGCPLSNMEVNLGGYKDVSDPAVTVKFKVENTENTYFLHMKDFSMLN